MTAPPPGLPKRIGGKFHQAGNTPSSAVWGNRLPQPVTVPKKRLENSVEEVGLFQLVSVPKRFPGIVWKRSGRPGDVCSKEIPGDSVEKFRLPRRCLFQRDSREQCRRRQTAPDRPVPKKHLRKSAGKVRLLQAVPVPKKSPGQGRLAALVPKRPPGGSSPHPPAQKNTRKVIGPSGCSVM